jgi:hypothetical protein
MASDVSGNLILVKPAGGGRSATFKPLQENRSNVQSTIQADNSFLLEFEPAVVHYEVIGEAKSAR